MLVEIIFSFIAAVSQVLNWGRRFTLKMVSTVPYSDVR